MGPEDVEDAEFTVVTPARAQPPEVLPWWRRFTMAKNWWVVPLLAAVLGARAMLGQNPHG